MKALCLQRSLVLLWLLRRRGIESELRIGVRKDGSALTAHAWIEMAGEFLNDSPDHCAQFVPLFDAAESLQTLRRAELAS
jgi:hypothetical protein